MDINVVCVCDKKYLKYFYTLLQSAKIYSPNLSFHVCLINQKRSRKHIELKAKNIYKKINFSYLERKFLNKANKRAFCANYRAEFLLHVLNKGFKNIIYMDVDSLIRRNIKEYNWYFSEHDISVYFRNSNEPKFKLLSGIISISGSNKSKVFLENWTKEIEDEIYSWFSDQVTFYKTYLKLRNNISFGNLDKQVIDWDFQKGSYIWAGKGNRKNKDLRYIKETLLIKARYLFSLFE